MATTRRVPAGESVTLTTNGTAYNLYTLLHALNAGTPKVCQVLRIQLDVAAGSAKLFIGTADYTPSATQNMAQLAASQVWPIDSVSSNLIQLQDIQLSSDTDGVRANITYVTR
jgi:hypothetical protein